MALPYYVDATWVNDTSASYDAGELRRADAAIFASGGVASGLTVTVDGSDVVTIQPGSVVIDGDLEVEGTGVYRAGLGAAQTGTLAARDATNGRIDLVVFRQYDTDVVPAHTDYRAAVEIVTGTPSASPVAPALPALAVELARVTVPASGAGAASVDSSSRTYASVISSVAVVGEINGGGQTLTSGTTAELSYSTVVESSPPSFAEVASNRLVVPRAGRYLVDASLRINGNATGRRELSVLVNGSAVRIFRQHSVSAVDALLNLGFSIRLDAGDLITTTGFQNSGSGLATATQRLSATYLSA